MGTACAAAYDEVSWWRAALALVVSVALQVGVNYANDYSDGVRGTDANRVGPLRLVASGLVPAKRVKLAAFAAFGVACLAGLALAATTTLWLVAVGAAAVAAAWFYTGGSKPYGYAGLGEPFVFLFFGPVPVVGTAYVAAQQPAVAWLAVLASLPVGLLAVAVLVANNLRDRPRDEPAGKRTLAVRIGDRATRRLYVGLAGIALLTTVAIAFWEPWALLGLLVVPLAVPPVRTVLAGETGPGLIPVLVATSRLGLVYGVLLALGIWL